VKNLYLVKTVGIKGGRLWKKGDSWRRRCKNFCDTEEGKFEIRRKRGRDCLYGEGGEKSQGGGLESVRRHRIEAREK